MAHIETPFDDPAERLQAGRFGMWLFLAALAMVFAASMLGYVVVRIDPINTRTWVPDDAPGIPWLLAVSSVVLLASSGTTWLATRAIARDDRGGLARWWLVTTLLAVAFLVLQAIAWVDLWRANVRIGDNLYAWTFYVLTGLHAAHVVAGLPLLGVVLVRAWRGRYDATHHRGVVYGAMYWHFLDVVWIALYAMLLLGS